VRKVLILAYDFPPYVSVGGLRPLNWYKYLHEFGVYPVIVTRQWSNKFGNHLDYVSAGQSDETIIEINAHGTIIRTPYRPNLANKIMLKYGSSKFRLIRRLISAYFELTQYLFKIGPKASLYFGAEEYLKKNKVDAIIATADPFILFGYAADLSAKFSVPWVADYRDPWTQKIHIQKNFLFKAWNTFFENRIVKTSSAITTVSELFRVKIGTSLNREIFILPNGYDPEAVDAAKEIIPDGSELAIAYVGTIYEWHPLRIFISVISKFVDSRKDVKLSIDFYGINMVEELNDIINDFPNVKNYVKIYPRMPNVLVLKEMARHHILLLFNYYSYIGTKIYDYLALNRKMLLCFSNDEEALLLKAKYYDVEEEEGVSMKVQEELILATNSGCIVKDSSHLFEKLNELYDEFLLIGTIRSETINAEKYSRKHQVKELAQIIRDLSGK
jgi:hypothetical protein